MRHQNRLFGVKDRKTVENELTHIGVQHSVLKAMTGYGTVPTPS